MQLIMKITIAMAMVFLVFRMMLLSLMHGRVAADVPADLTIQVPIVGRMIVN